MIAIAVQRSSGESRASSGACAVPVAQTRPYPFGEHVEVRPSAGHRSHGTQRYERHLRIGLLPYRSALCMVAHLVHPVAIRGRTHRARHCVAATWLRPRGPDRSGDYKCAKRHEFDGETANDFRVSCPVSSLTDVVSSTRQALGPYFSLISVLPSMVGVVSIVFPANRARLELLRSATVVYAPPLPTPRTGR